MQEQLIKTNKNKIDELYEIRMNHYNKLCSKLKILQQQKIALIESYKVVIREIDKQISEMDGVQKWKKNKKVN
jgi:hypothetical protein